MSSALASCPASSQGLVGVLCSSCIVFQGHALSHARCCNHAALEVAHLKPRGIGASMVYDRCSPGLTMRVPLLCALVPAHPPALIMRGC